MVQGWNSSSGKRSMTQVKDQPEDPLNGLKSSWVDADGITHEVITRRREAETTEDMVNRHVEKVELLKASFPPVPPPPSGG